MSKTTTKTLPHNNKNNNKIAITHPYRLIGRYHSVEHTSDTETHTTYMLMGDGVCTYRRVKEDGDDGYGIIRVHVCVCVCMCIYVCVCV